jgi:hypothetical protein
MLDEWIKSLASDMEYLVGLQSIAKKNGPNKGRAENIAATKERIEQARREIERERRK